jgi:hypothetical protein
MGIASSQKCTTLLSSLSRSNNKDTQWITAKFSSIQSTVPIDLKLSGALERLHCVLLICHVQKRPENQVPTAYKHAGIDDRGKKMGSH